MAEDYEIEEVEMLTQPGRFIRVIEFRVNPYKDGQLPYHVFRKPAAPAAAAPGDDATRGSQEPATPAPDEA